MSRTWTNVPNPTLTRSNVQDLDQNTCPLVFCRPEAYWKAPPSISSMCHFVGQSNIKMWFTWMIQRLNKSVTFDQTRNEKPAAGTIHIASNMSIDTLIRKYGTITPVCSDRKNTSWRKLLKYNRRHQFQSFSTFPFVRFPRFLIFFLRSLYFLPSSQVTQKTQSLLTRCPLASVCATTPGKSSEMMTCHSLLLHPDKNELSAAAMVAVMS